MCHAINPAGCSAPAECTSSAPGTCAFLHPLGHLCYGQLPLFPPESLLPTQRPYPQRWLKLRHFSKTSRSNALPVGSGPNSSGHPASPPQCGPKPFLVGQQSSPRLRCPSLPRLLSWTSKPHSTCHLHTSSWMVPRGAHPFPLPPTPQCFYSDRPWFCFRASDLPCSHRCSHSLDKFFFQELFYPPSPCLPLPLSSFLDDSHPLFRSKLRRSFLRESSGNAWGPQHTMSLLFPS